MIDDVNAVFSCRVNSVSVVSQLSPLRSFLHVLQEDWLEVSQADLDTLLQNYSHSGVRFFSRIRCDHFCACCRRM